MVLRTLSRPIRWPLALGTAVAATLAAGPPAAAAGATISRDPGDPRVLVVDASGAPALLDLGWDDTTFTVDTVTFELRGDRFAAWPGDCGKIVDSLGGEAIACPAADVGGVRASLGPGNDAVSVQGVCVPVITVNLGEGGNQLWGNEPCGTVHHVTSGAGDDYVRMASGGGTASLGAGNDHVRGGVGAETVSAGPGNDVLEGGPGDDNLQGDDGNDSIRGGSGNDVESGGHGDDSIGGELGSDSASDDDQGSDDVHGGPGTDKLLLGRHTGGGMTITLDGRADDGIAGEGDNFHADLEHVVGSPFDDTIVGSAAAETLVGELGRDTISGGGGGDAIDGSYDDDVLNGGDGNDTVQGGGGNDRVTGDGGTDQLYGDYPSWLSTSGNDSVFAADGVADAINCGGGADSVAADQLDVVGQDGLQACESVTRTTVTTTTTSALVVGARTIGRATRRKGIRLAVTCSVACDAAVRVRIAKRLAKRWGLGTKVLIGRGRGSTASAGTFTVRTRITARARRRLARAGTVPAVVALTVTDASGARQARTMKVRLRR